MAGIARRGRRVSTSVVTGAILLVLVVVALFAVYQKQRIATMFTSGGVVKAEFARDYQMEPNKTQVKVAGVVVGTVTGVQPAEQGHVVVSMKVDEDTIGKLGRQPSALVRPTTLLGGNYYVQLTLGGTGQSYDGGTIPVSRTNVPVELDQVLAAVPQTARTSIQKTTAVVDGALTNGAGAALATVLNDAPGTLTPAAAVLSGIQGTRPGQDLSTLVPDLDSMAAVMSARNGQQLGTIVDSLNQLSATLDSSRTQLTDTVATLPQTLSATRSGLASLQSTLTQLTTTATDALPTAQELGPLLSTANPVLQQALPLVQNLQPLLAEALPVVRTLVPTAQQATSTLNDVRGPVLDRINGPIANAVLSPWSGSGYYQGDGGNGHLFYQEVGYLAAHAANLSMYGDKNGRMLGLALGVGVSTAGGDDPGVAELLQTLGLLPASGLQLLPSPSTGNNGWTGEPATAPGHGAVLTGPLSPVIGPNLGTTIAGLGKILGLDPTSSNQSQGK